MNKVTILVGPSGAGKSTYVKEKIEKPHVYLNADTIRKELYGDESIQGDGRCVFGVLYKRISDHIIAAGPHPIHIVVDNTSTTYKARKELYKLIPEGFWIEVICIVPPIETSLARNLARERSVPDEVIYRQYSQLQIPDAGEIADKIDAIVYISR